jgi:hypothetical protein
MTRDDERLARASRLLRRRAGIRQVDATVSRHIVQAIESGRAGRLRLDDVRSHFERFDARTRLTVWWHGADLDRLFDARHAGVVEAGLAELRKHGWQTAGEVSFNEYGDRGSIDLFAGKESEAAIFVGEAKSEWGSIEETLRRLDVKARVAPKIAFQLFGFRPHVVAAVLLFPEDRTARRIADRYAVTLDSAFPARALEIRRWLKEPVGRLRGLWFLTNASADGHKRATASRKAANR